MNLVLNVTFVLYICCKDALTVLNVLMAHADSRQHARDSLWLDARKGDPLARGTFLSRLSASKSTGLC